ncbi:MAG: hypothetical protein QM704_13185 [Anaeromyxobacteraceae bacterium]
MQKLVLMSVIFMSIVLPAIAAGERDARLAVKKAALWYVAGVCVYAFLVMFVYPRFVG